MEASRIAKTEKSTSSSIKCEGFAHCFLSSITMAWCGILLYYGKEYYLELMRETIHQKSLGKALER